MNISLSPIAPENLVSRDGFGRPASAFSFSILKLNLMLTHGIMSTMQNDAIQTVIR